MLIRIQECVGANTDVTSLRYNYEFVAGDPPGGITDTFYTYNNPGIYSIQQTGNVNGTGTTLPKFNYIEVLASPDPEYQVFVCDDNGIVIEITNPVYEEYFFDFKDGSPIVTLDINVSTRVQHSYGSPGIKNFSIQGNYVPGGCGALIEDTVTTLNDIPVPQISDFKTSITPFTISFNFSAIDRVFYYVLQSKDGGNSFSDVQISLPGPGIHTYSLNNPGDTVENQCFRVEARDECGNVISSQTLCGIELSATPFNNRNEISWTPYKGPDHDGFDLYRDGQLIQSFLPSYPPQPFYDSAITCGGQYCYTIKSRVNMGTDSSVSNEVCLVSFSTDTPSAVTNALISTDIDISTLFWDPGMNVVNYTVYAQVSTGFAPIGTTITTQFEIGDIGNPTLQPCFQIGFLDSCQNNSFRSITQCPMILNVQTAPNFGHKLNWDEYIGWDEGVRNYEVQKLNTNGQVYFSELLDSLTLTWEESGIDTNFQNYYYRVVAFKSGSDTITSSSNWELVKQKFKIFFPNAFTPNNDGLNDTFKGEGRFVETFQILIINQWGEVIYESKDFNEGWNGKINGNDAQLGNYIYVVKAEDARGNKFEERGNLTLLR